MMRKQLNIGKQLRFRRLSRRGGTVIVPMDHGTSGEPAEPIKDLQKLVKTIAQTQADGIVVTPGMLEYVAPVVGDLSICLRMDAGPTRLGQGANLEKIDFTTTVESALALGADAVIGNFYVGTENEDYHMGRLGKLATQCRKFGVPLIAEMLPVTVLNYHYGLEDKKLSIKQINKDLCLVARVGAELGADCIKTHYSGDKLGFKQVIESTPIPVWLAGGPKGGGSDSDFLAMVTDAASAGATGVVIGRNVWLRDNIKEIITELCKIFHT